MSLDGRTLTDKWNNAELSKRRTQRKIDYRVSKTRKARLATSFFWLLGVPFGVPGADISFARVHLRIDQNSRGRKCQAGSVIQESS